MQAPLNFSLPQPNVMNGGAAVGVPAFVPPGTSIASSSSAVASPTPIVKGGIVWSKRRLSSILRGLPLVNFWFGEDLPLTFSASQVFVFAIEYSVGLK